MNERASGTDPRGEHTRAVHPPQPEPLRQGPESPPVYRSAAFRFETAQDYADVLGDRAPGYSYSRVDNPTADQFATAVAAAESARLGAAADDVVGQPFASGMAAIATTLLALTEGGAHVVAAHEVYGGTHGLLRDVLARFGVSTSFVDISDVSAVRRAMRDATRVVWAETLANPTMTVADLPALAEIAHGNDAALCVDSTFASPAVCRPLEWGADVVVHSATKYIGGHGDATGGVAVGRRELLDRIRHHRIDLGGTLAPDEAFLLHRGLTTLPLRMERHCLTALGFAEAMAALQAQGRLLRVDYPGLSSHRDHALAGKLFDAGPSGTRYGAVVTIALPGGRSAGMAFCDALRLLYVSTSLGSLHSKVSHVASTTHRQLGDAELAAAGIDPSAVRISIGLEDLDDLLGDVRQALDTVGR